MLLSGIGPYGLLFRRGLESFQISPLSTMTFRFQEIDVG